MKNRPAIVDASRAAAVPERGMRARLTAAKRHLVDLVRAPGLPDVARDRDAEPLPGRTGGLGRSFALFVVLPTVLFALWTLVFAADQYVTEVRFTVRSDQEQSKIVESLSVLSKLGDGSGSTNLQNAFMVSNYIQSRSIVADVGGEAALLKIWGTDRADVLSRLRGGTSEELWKYWNRRIQVQVNNVSNIVFLKVWAFDPQSSRDLAAQIVARSEALVNDISLRIRKDAMADAEAEATQARDRLLAAREALRDYRTRNLYLDPGAAATSIGQLLTSLSLERLKTQNELTALTASLAPTTPSVRIVEGRLAALDRQIAELQARLTDRSEGSIAATTGRFEQLSLEEKFAERLYTTAEAALQRARQNLGRQALYLMVIVPPSLPQAALYPDPPIDIAAFFFVALILWGIVTLTVSSIRENMV